MRESWWGLKKASTTVFPYFPLGLCAEKKLVSGGNKDSGPCAGHPARKRAGDHGFGGDFDEVGAAGGGDGGEAADLDGDGGEVGEAAEGVCGDLGAAAGEGLFFDVRGEIEVRLELCGDDLGA